MCISSNILHNNKRCWFSLGKLCKFLHFHVLLYTFTKTCISPISKLTTFFGFLGYVQERERHTFEWARTYTIEFLEVGTKNKRILDLNVPHRHQNNMLNLHATNKENMAHELTLNNKRQSIQLNWTFVTCKRAMWTYDAP